MVKRQKGKIEPSQELKNQIKKLQKVKLPPQKWKKRQGKVHMMFSSVFNPVLGQYLLKGKCL